MQRGPAPVLDPTMSAVGSGAGVAAQERTTMRTEFDFELPRGYVDRDGVVHRQGTMRLATARDELLPLYDERVQENPAFTTVVLLDASIMVSGAVVTESVFAWPGLGSLFTDALARRDYTVLMAFLMCASVAVVTLSVVADLVVYALDPRAREAR